MTQPFVGTSKDPINEKALRTLINDCVAGDCWYFLRSPHGVSGIKHGKPNEFRDAEGQIFNTERELRWKRHGDTYHVLVLSATAFNTNLEVLGQNWEMQDLNANVYTQTETRLPKTLHYPNDLDVGQRYFIDAETGIVQFVAMTGQRNTRQSNTAEER